MIVGFVILLAPVVAWCLWRRRVKNRRAGLSASAPVFSVSPPAGRIRRATKDVL